MEGVKNEAHLRGMGATFRLGRLREGLERVTVYSHHLPDAKGKAKHSQARILEWVIVSFSMSSS